VFQRSKIRKQVKGKMKAARAGATTAGAAAMACTFTYTHKKMYILSQQCQKHLLTVNER